MKILHVADRIIETLEPCLNRERVQGRYRYQTTWGSKTREGLRQMIIEMLNEAEQEIGGEVL